MGHGRLRPLWTLVLLMVGAAMAHATAADGVDVPPLASSKLYLEITPDGRNDLEALFRALEQSLLAGERQTDPVIIILHGPEALPFLRRNYAKNRDIVDRAAKLEAFRRIELRMCETWMRENGLNEDDLLPFVGTVPLAPEEIERLEKEGYLRFSPAMTRSELL
jgi:intracellular sulfur oxidation DsrE/DsrF family protein